MHFVCSRLVPELGSPHPPASESSAHFLALPSWPESCAVLATDRASGPCVADVEVLRVERVQLLDAVLNLCTYHHPENIQLPPG